MSAHVALQGNALPAGESKRKSYAHTPKTAHHAVQASDALVKHSPTTRGFMGSKKSERCACRKSAAPTSVIPPTQFLVVVHPGSACGSADFNYGSRKAAEAARQMLIRELRNWQGGVIVIDGALSDELQACAQLNEALSGLLARAVSAGLPAVRLPGDDPNQDRATASIIRRLKLSRNSVQFVVTGAWHYAGEKGCVGSVCRTIRDLGYQVAISPAALTGEAAPADPHGMNWYEVTVFAVAENGDEARLGGARLRALSLPDAERLALAELWDERLIAASCRARYESKLLKCPLAEKTSDLNGLHLTDQ